MIKTNKHRTKAAEEKKKTCKTNTTKQEKEFKKLHVDIKITVTMFHAMVHEFQQSPMFQGVSRISTPLDPKRISLFTRGQNGSGKLTTSGGEARNWAVKIL